MKTQNTDSWDIIIEPNRGVLQVPVHDIWRYRDLIFLFVRRDFVAFYKQTILGPLWFILQPILTTLMFTLVFGNIAGLSTDGLPKIMFYLAGVTIWGYFSDCLTKTATTFTDNAYLYGKVYFPRMVTPLAVILSNLMRFGIQYSIFLVFLLYYWSEDLVNPNYFVLLTPILIVIMAAISLGLGLAFSAMTTKYRDLRFLLQFGVQLLMFATPVIYPVSSIPEKYVFFIQLNPLSPVIETFRYAYLGVGTFSVEGLLYSGIVAMCVLVIGTIIFNRFETTFMDTV